MRNSLIRLALATACLATTTASADSGTDFDVDGRSDLTTITINKDSSLTWQAKLSTANQVTTLADLGKNGDHVVLARWTGTNKPQIGGVRLDKSTKEITWTILDDSGASHSLVFGKDGDLVVSGGDFDGNGIADAAVVRLVKNAAQWEVVLNPFNGGNTTAPQKFSFGKSGDRVFFYSQDGVTDLIATVRKGTGRNSVVRIKNLKTDVVKSYSRFPAFASTGNRPRPFPIHQASGADLLGFITIKKSSTLIKFTTATGTASGDVEFDGTGDVIVGDFNDSPGEEVAFQNKTTLYIYNPVVGETIESSAIGGILVDEININTLSSATTPDTGASNPPPSGGNDGNNDTPDAGSPGAACSSTSPWPGTLVYKIMGSNHFTDVRRNTFGVIGKIGFGGPFPNCVQALDSSGKTLALLGLYSRGAGWAARYYAGIGCGASTAINGAALASKARANTGSSNVYMNFGGVCYGPIDATKCIGSQQC